MRDDRGPARRSPGRRTGAGRGRSSAGRSVGRRGCGRARARPSSSRSSSARGSSSVSSAAAALRNARLVEVADGSVSRKRGYGDDIPAEQHRARPTAPPRGHRGSSRGRRRHAPRSGGYPDTMRSLAALAVLLALGAAPAQAARGLVPPPLPGPGRSRRSGRKARHSSSWRARAAPSRSRRQARPWSRRRCACGRCPGRRRSASCRGSPQPARCAPSGPTGACSSRSNAVT